jgi:Tfp pilus tip-associated adhesin PilY1
MMQGRRKSVALLSAVLWIATDLLVGLTAPLENASAQAIKDAPFFAANLNPPNVLIILDRSGSMRRIPDDTAVGSYCGDNPWGSGCANENKISIAVRVLADLQDDTNNLAVDNTDDPNGLGVRLGYAEFLSVPSGSPTGEGEGAAPQYNYGNIRVRWGVGSNYTDIFTTINRSDTGGWTPNGTALREALQYFTNDASITGDAAKACRKHYVILVTDGMDTVTCEAGTESTRNRRSGAYAAFQLRNTDTLNTEVPDPGIPVYVVGLGNLPAADQNVLNWIAFHGGTDNPLMTNAGNTAAVSAPAALCSDGTDPQSQNLSGYAFIATSAGQLATALKAAILQIRTGSYTRSAPVLSLAGSTLYQGYFLLPGWMGHLEAFALDSNGTPQTPSTYDAGTLLLNRSADTREMFTAVAGGGGFTRTPFTVANANTLQAPLNAATLAEAQTIINYVRDPGYQNGAYRGQRNLPAPAVEVNWKLQDIYHSTPRVVGPPLPLLSLRGAPGYVAFQSTYINRPLTIYVGTNGGTLEAFDAQNGKELWAFIPNNLLGKLQDLRIAHEFFVDATPAVADVCVAGCDKTAATWKTVLIGGEGRGGRAYFALDVTNPTSVTSYPQPLWEFTDAALGQTWSRPAIGRVKLKSGGGGAGGSSTDRWVAFVGGGYDPSASTTKVMAIDIATGQLLQEGAITAVFDLGLITTKNNTPGAVRAVDADFDGYLDFVYIGDTEGRLHKIDVRSEKLSDWLRTTNPTGAVAPRPYLLYDPADDALTRNPILYAPSVVTSTDPASGERILFVSFGTGYYEDSKLDAQNYVYILKDTLKDFERDSAGDSAETARPALRAYLWTGKSGTGIPSLQIGEKILGSPVTFESTVFFTTFLPTQGDPCAVGQGFLWGIQLFDFDKDNSLAGLYQGEGAAEAYKVGVGEGLPASPVINPQTRTIYTSTSNVPQPLGSPLGPALGGGRIKSWREAY